MRISPVIFALGLIAAASSLRADAPSRQVPDQYQNVGVDEHPNAQIPLDLTFLDDHNRIVPLRDFFQSGHPVVLQLGYFGCPKLCDVISQSFVASASKIDSLTIGKDFQFVFVSINPRETPDLAAMKKQSLIDAYGRFGVADGFHCMVGEQKNITALADAVGYRYHAVDVDGQFAHPAVIFVLTPEGKISRYLYGVAVPSDTLKLSLVEAGKGNIGSSWDKLALLICCYDVDTGKYTLAATRLMSLAGIMTVLAVGGGIFWLHRRTQRLHGIN